MDVVKTYHKVNKSNDRASFAISRMEEIYAKRNGEQDQPHRHDYFTVIVVKKARGIHRIDFNSYQLEASQIHFVAPGQVHQVMEEESSYGFAMTFSTQFLIENSIPLFFVESLNLFHEYGQSPPLEPNPQQFDKLVQYTNEINDLFSSDANMKELSIGAYLKLFLIECNNVCAVHPIDTHLDVSENRIVREFKALVNQHFRMEHSTSYYASVMHITPDHLNRIIKGTIGKTAKEYIQSRITTEAKRLLYFSSLSNKEIGFELGFGEPANFSAFFKKCTGFSPSGFRQNELQH